MPWYTPFYNQTSKCLAVHQANLRRCSNGAPAELLEDLLLEALPADLCILDVSYSDITKLPILPTTVTHLYIAGNKLTHVVLHEGLQVLHCEMNPLEAIVLPSTLRSLYCTGCPISTLDTLPTGLKELYAGHWKLQTITQLPSTLERLHIEAIMSLKIHAFPPMLKTIYLAGRSGVASDAVVSWDTIPPLPEGLEMLTLVQLGLKHLPPIASSVKLTIL
jgi:hypothetical protein